MATKFTDEQLSRIISAHAAEGLWIGGYKFGHGPCLVEAAVEPIDIELSIKAERWFDARYDRRCSPDEFLAQLEARGLA